MRVPETVLNEIWDMIEQEYLSKYSGLIKIDPLAESGFMWSAFPGAHGGLSFHCELDIPNPLRVDFREWKAKYDQFMSSEDYPAEQIQETLETRGLELALMLRSHLPIDVYLEQRDFREIALTEAGAIELPAPKWVVQYQHLIR